MPVLLRLLKIILIIPTITWAFSPYSNNELDQLEKEFVQQINQAGNIIRTPVATAYINHLGKRLAQQGHMQPPDFFIVNSNEINAFAGPGGHIGVNSALILATANESELAAVMAHEMAHVRLHHLYRMIEHQKQMRIPMLASVLASIALGVVNPAIGSGALMASLTGFSQDSINFVRSNEKEADRIGIDMLIKTNLNPHSMADFFKKMQENARYYYTVNIPAILRTHPLDEERIAEAENRCPKTGNKIFSENINYNLFKELIRNTAILDSKQLLDYYQKTCLKSSTERTCNYGKTLTLLTLNQYQKAQDTIMPLWQKEPNNMYFTIALAEADIGLANYAASTALLKELDANFPDDYAALMAYGEGLLAANNATTAATVFLRGTRLYKNDLVMCWKLALAFSESHRKDYAYFTDAQCYLLQGAARPAIQRLKVAQKLTRDPYLKIRIAAKIDEIKTFISDDKN